MATNTALPGWPHPEPPFHEGERTVQQRLGMAERLAEVGRRVVRGVMPDPHRELFGKLPFMLLGALDAQGRPWATMLAGAPGFVRTPDARTLHIGARPIGEPALALRLGDGDPVGLLGLEPATRRRNRVNGVLVDDGATGLRVAVTQSFGNCPQYIQPRRFEPVTPGPARAPVPVGRRLPPAAAALVGAADTFFIATASAGAGQPHARASDGLDVSHRGGPAGFVRVGEDDDRSVLTVPDYAGNFFFNTLGNLVQNPRAGLLFADWQGGDLLLLTGLADIVWDGPDVAAWDGAQRLLRWRLDAGWWLAGALPLRAATAMV